MLISRRSRRINLIAAAVLMVGTAVAYEIIGPITSGSAQTGVVASASASPSASASASGQLLTQIVADDPGASSSPSPSSSAPSPTPSATTASPSPSPSKTARPTPPRRPRPTPIVRTIPTPVPTHHAPTHVTSDGYGCGPAIAYLDSHAAPGFRIECPGYAYGNQAMTCAYHAPQCPNSEIIVIAVPCAAAYKNEANNSWILSGRRQGSIDPYGYCH